MHFIILISGSKSVKLAQKFRIFLKFLTLKGTLLTTVNKFDTSTTTVGKLASRTVFARVGEIFYLNNYTMVPGFTSTHTNM